MEYVNGSDSVGHIKNAFSFDKGTQMTPCQDFQEPLEDQPESQQMNTNPFPLNTY